ncbi:MAG: hypothetical protein SNH88_08030 [Rikenellaceae bacterium]
MNNEQKKAVSNALAQNLGVLIGIAVFGTLATIYNWGGIQDVEPGKVYEWGRGMNMGFWFPVNYVVSFFKDGVVVKDALHTSGYNIWWWICCIWASAYVIIKIFSVLIGAFVLRKL